MRCCQARRRFFLVPMINDDRFDSTDHSSVDFQMLILVKTLVMLTLRGFDVMKFQGR